MDIMNQIKGWAKGLADVGVSLMVKVFRSGQMFL